MALDVKGITLKEVTSRYPEEFQTLKYDVAFDTDSMSKPKVVSSFDLAINAVLTLLLMKPGQYPSIPELGIDIESYLFRYSDDKKIISEIQSKLEDQCSIVGMVGFDIDISMQTMTDGNDALIIVISGTDTLTYGNEGSKVVIGITHDKLQRLYIRKQFIH
jgi:hypothetical protein